MLGSEGGSVVFHKENNVNALSGESRNAGEAETDETAQCLQRVNWRIVSGLLGNRPVFNPLCLLFSRRLLG
jgi:hypothetical protein